MRRGSSSSTEEDEIWESLRELGFLHALLDAHQQATVAVFTALSRGAGFKERSYGTTSFDVFESHLDRVFHVTDDPSGLSGAEARDSLAERVVRDNLNGSPGWRIGRYRVLLKRHGFGSVRSIRWDQDSPTKQSVARQDYAANPQLAFDLGDLGGLVMFAVPADVITLVVAHSATEDPLEMELFIGRPRYNEDGGDPWWWIRTIKADRLGNDPRTRLEPAASPLWTEFAEDAPVRLREPGREAAESGR